MQLELVHVRNFKGLRDAEFRPATFSCLVGENNAGKSTVLQAIAFALNRPTQLPQSMYYDAESAVKISLTFSGISHRDTLRLSPEHRSKISELLVDGKLFIEVQWPSGDKCEVKTCRREPIEVRYRREAMDEVFKGKTGNAVRQTLLENYPEFADDVPQPLNITQAKSFLEDKIMELDEDQFELVMSPLPSGIPSSISKLLPEPIYIPAVRNLSDELKTTQSTSFGRLLGLLLEDMAPDLEVINNTFSDLDALLNRRVVDGAVVDQRHDKVKDLEKLVEGYLKENFPRIKVDIAIPPPEIRTVLNSAQIFVDDGSRDIIDNKGDGIKRSLTFSLLQAYVARLDTVEVPEGDEDVPLPRPLVFMFEEPELYLHPKSQKILFQTLARISQSRQVIVTTHSPIFFAPGVTANFVRIAKEEAEPKPIARLYPVEFELDAEKAEVFKMARFEHADAAFFSRRVVLFEGESDDAFCGHVAQLLNERWNFDKENVALVRVSGKGNFARFRQFFEAFGIEVKIVADLDALFEGFQHLGAPKHGKLRASVFQTIDARIAELGIVAEPATRQIKDKIQQTTWRGRYENAKAAVRRIQETGTIDDNALATLNELFVWEQDIARVNACREDATAAQALVPLLDALRDCGVCILSKGAIEDYYPEEAPTSGPKPERAFAACKLVTSPDAARQLSRPLSGGRVDELSEIFAEIFRH